MNQEDLIEMEMNNNISNNKMENKTIRELRQD